MRQRHCPALPNRAWHEAETPCPGLALPSTELSQEHRHPCLGTPSWESSRAVSFPPSPRAPLDWYLQEGEDEADGEVAEPVERAPHNVGSGAVGLHEELSCHQEGDTSCRGRGHIKGREDRVTQVPLGSTGSAHLSPVAKGLEPSKAHGSNWCCWESGGHREWWSSVLPSVSLGMCLVGGDVMSPDIPTGTLLGAQASSPGCMTGKFQTESK